MFSAVASAFIVAIQTQLQPDYTQLSYDLLWMMANSTGLNPPAKPSSDSPWTGPDPALVNVQAILFSSLAVSLLAAFLAMLGKQWLSRYSQVDTPGSLIDRGRDRHRKMDGIATWRFKFVMESLPLMLQVALLLLDSALSKYLFIIDSLVAWVVVGFTACGFLFYFVIVVAATASYDCPFQTPLSLIIRFIVNLFKERENYLKGPRKWFNSPFFPKRRRRRQQPGGPRHLISPSRSDENNVNEDIRLHIVGSSRPPLVPFDPETDQDSYVLDSNCIAWMFKMSTDPDIILHIMKFIPEIVWHDGIQTTPLEELYDTVLKFFDHSSGSSVVVPKLRNNAYLSAKALLHLSVQRKCMGDEYDEEVFYSISSRHQVIGSRHYKGDSDLESTFGMIDRVLLNRGFEPMRWQEFSLTGPHHTWMSGVLLSFAWDALRIGKPLPMDVRVFVLHSLELVPPPPTQIIRNCLHVIYLVLNIDLNYGDLGIIDIRSVALVQVFPEMNLNRPAAQKSSAQVKMIYDKLVGMFENNNSAAAEIDGALEAMEFITALSKEEVATRSYKLFCVIMRTPISSVCTQEKKWEGSRLALHGAYKSDQFLPQVEDPRNILDFLEYHFDSATLHGKNQDGPIRNALRALNSVPGSVMDEAFKHFDPIKRSFIDGILHVFQKSKPPQLLKPALFFLPLIADRWFSASSLIMKPGEMGRLCKGWSAAVDKVWSTDDIREPVLAVLLDMINSPGWRPYVVKDKWELLKHLTSVPADSQPLGRCLGNPDLVDAISQVKNPDIVVIWWMVLWSRYEKLIPEVQKRFDKAVKGAQWEDVDRYLSVTKLESEEAEKELLGYGPLSTDPKAIALKAKVAKLETMRCALKHIQSVA